MFPRKLKAEVLGRQKTKQPWFALLHLSLSNDHYLYVGSEKLDFHTLGKLNLFCYKWLRERQRRPTANHIIIWWPACRRDAHVCLDHCDDVTNKLLHIWDVLLHIRGGFFFPCNAYSNHTHSLR